MVELEQYKFTVNQYKEPMKELGLSLSLSHKHEQIKELESEMREEDFWNNPDKAQEVTKKLKNLKDTVSAYQKRLAVRLSATESDVKLKKF